MGKPSSRPIVEISMSPMSKRRLFESRACWIRRAVGQVSSPETYARLFPQDLGLSLRPRLALGLRKIPRPLSVRDTSSRGHTFYSTPSTSLVTEGGYAQRPPPTLWALLTPVQAAMPLWLRGHNLTSVGRDLPNFAQRVFR